LATKQSRRRAGGPRRAAADATRLDHGLLPGLLGYQLRLAQQAVFRDFERTAEGLGVSPGRFGMLVLIEANPGVTQSRLAQEVGLDRSTLVAILDDLESRALVERRQGEDRRTNGLRLTRRGKTLVEKMKGRVAEHEARIAARLTAVEQRQLLDLLQRLVRSGDY
jgi:DNA-binding MarR family transcriptional regulator